MSLCFSHRKLRVFSGAKPHWMQATAGPTGERFHLFSISRSSWVFGRQIPNVHNQGTHSLRIESYEDSPPYEVRVWQEECGAGGSAQVDRRIMLTPGFTDHDCTEDLTLLAADLTAFCCEEGRTFEEALAGDTPPDSCGYDCAHSWYRFAEGCSQFLSRRHPSFMPFSALCNATVSQMSVLDVDGTLDAAGHSHDDHVFTASEDLVYSIDEIPGGNLTRTGLALETGHANHSLVLADRMDVSRHGERGQSLSRFVHCASGFPPSYVQLQFLSLYLLTTELSVRQLPRRSWRAPHRVRSSADRG